MTLVEEQPKVHGASLFALLFVSGADQGKRLPLPLQGVVLFGRASDADVILTDCLTSRRHAALGVQDGQVVLEDLESTNGTYVNGEKIRRAVLQPGDRLLIGTMNCELVAGEAPPALARPPAPVAKTSEAADWETTTLETGRLISGLIKEIPIVDLLQLLCHSRKSGILIIRSEQGLGRMYLREGRICGANINGSCAVTPERTVYRLLRWQRGTFELRPLEQQPVKEEITQPTEVLLLEGACQHDELVCLEKMLPDLSAQMTLANPLPAELQDLLPQEIDLCLLVLKHRTFLKVIDDFCGTDLEAYRYLAGLLERKFVVVETPAFPLGTDTTSPARF